MRYSTSFFIAALASSASAQSSLSAHSKPSGTPPSGAPPSGLPSGFPSGFPSGTGGFHGLDQGAGHAFATGSKPPHPSGSGSFGSGAPPPMPTGEPTDPAMVRRQEPTGSIPSGAPPSGTPPSGGPLPKPTGGMFASFAGKLAGHAVASGSPPPSFSGFPSGFAHESGHAQPSGGPEHSGTGAPSMPTGLPSKVEARQEPEPTGSHSAFSGQPTGFSGSPTGFPSGSRPSHAFPLGAAKPSGFGNKEQVAGAAKPSGGDHGEQGGPAPTGSFKMPSGLPTSFKTMVRTATA